MNVNRVHYPWINSSIRVQLARSRKPFDLPSFYQLGTKEQKYFPSQAKCYLTKTH